MNTKNEVLKLALDDLIAEYHMETSSFAKRVDEIFKQSRTAPVQPVACVIGAKGSAFDVPETKRAYTYKEQPGNAVAYKLGNACDAASKQSAGGNIDRGLGLLQELQEAGFGVFDLGAEYTTAQPAPVQTVRELAAKSFMVHLYNFGYKAGHHDTVEGRYIDICRQDMETYHLEDVSELLQDMGYTTPPAQPAVQEPVFCEYCGGSDDADFGLPTDHCTDCDRPQPAAQPAVPEGWQPIETAPKCFCTEFDGWNGKRVPDVSWARPEFNQRGDYTWCVQQYENGYGWVNVEVKGLTHWRPSPAAPEKGGA